MTEVPLSAPGIPRSLRSRPLTLREGGWCIARSVIGALGSRLFRGAKGAAEVVMRVVLLFGRCGMVCNGRVLFWIRGVRVCCIVRIRRISIGYRMVWVRW